jgi:hypothetical protein
MGNQLVVSHQNHVDHLDESFGTRIARASQESWEWRARLEAGQLCALVLSLLKLLSVKTKVLNSRNAHQLHVLG